MNVTSLFPTPVAHFKYDGQLTEKQRSFVYSAEQQPNEGNTTSTCKEVLDRELFADIKNFALYSLQQYLEKIINVQNNSSLRITQSWFNYTKKGQWHHKHTHPNSMLSGVFYINADPNKDKIFFYKDGYQQIKFPVSEWNPFNSESWWLPVCSNELIIFPSQFSHSVAPVETEETRVSLSFNTFPVGDIGDFNALTGLKL